MFADQVDSARGGGNVSGFHGEGGLEAAFGFIDELGEIHEFECLRVNLKW